MSANITSVTPLAPDIDAGPRPHGKSVAPGSEFSVLVSLLMGQLDNQAQVVLPSPEEQHPGPLPLLDPGEPTRQLPATSPASIVAIQWATYPPPGADALPRKLEPELPMSEPRVSPPRGSPSVELVAHASKVEGAQASLSDPQAAALLPSETLELEPHLGVLKAGGNPSAGAPTVPDRPFGHQLAKPPSTPNEKFPPQTTALPQGLERAAALWQERPEQSRRPQEILPAAPLRESAPPVSGGDDHRPTLMPVPHPPGDHPSMKDTGGHPRPQWPISFHSVGAPITPDLPGPLTNDPTAPAINLRDIALQIVNRAHLLALGDRAVFELHLEPPGLGQLKVKLSLNADGLSVDMSTATKEARQALAASIGELHNALTARGLNIANLSLSSETAGLSSGFGTHRDPSGHPATVLPPNPNQNSFSDTSDAEDEVISEATIDIRI